MLHRWLQIWCRYTFATSAKMQLRVMRAQQALWPASKLAWTVFAGIANSINLIIWYSLSSLKYARARQREPHFNVRTKLYNLSHISFSRYVFSWPIPWEIRINRWNETNISQHLFRSIRCISVQYILFLSQQASKT